MPARDKCLLVCNKRKGIIGKKGQRRYRGAVLVVSGYANRPSFANQSAHFEKGSFHLFSEPLCEIIRNCKKCNVCSGSSPGSRYTTGSDGDRFKIDPVQYKPDIML